MCAESCPHHACDSCAHSCIYIWLMHDSFLGTYPFAFHIAMHAVHIGKSVHIGWPHPYAYYGMGWKCRHVWPTRAHTNSDGFRLLNGVPILTYTISWWAVSVATLYVVAHPCTHKVSRPPWLPIPCTHKAGGVVVSITASFALILITTLLQVLLPLPLPIQLALPLPLTTNH